MEKEEEGDDEKWMYVLDEFHMPLSSQTRATGSGSGSPSQIPILDHQCESRKTDHNQNLGFLYPLPSGFYVFYSYRECYNINDFAQVQHDTTF